MRLAARILPDRGLDAFNALVAAIQTAFGPFMAVYLGGQGWSQTQIGTALSLSTLAVLLAQLPAGMAVDAARDPRVLARVAVLALGAALLLLAFWPAHGGGLLAMALQGVASALLGPAIAALSLAVAGRAILGQRLGRNTRFAAIGNAVMAASFGLGGAYWADQTVLALVALLVLPAWLSLRGPTPGHGGGHIMDAAPRPQEIQRLLRDPRLTIFAFCVGAFHLASAAMLPLTAASLARAQMAHTDFLVAVSIMVPPGIAVLFAPAIGRFAEQRGRRGLLLLGWAMLPAQALALALLPSPWLLPAAQMLGGVGIAIFAVLLPLVAADLSHGTRRFTLCLSSLSIPVAIGASLSTILAGLVADRAGDMAAFLGLGLVGLGGVALLWLAMPETRVTPASPF